MKAHKVMINFLCDDNEILDIDVVNNGLDDESPKKTLRLEVRKEGSEDSISFVQLENEEAIELRDFLLYCYPKE